jgi:hypothetical protein
VFIAPALAFLTSWKLVGVFAPKPWVRSLAALGYSLSPLVLGAALGGEVVELTALVFAPLAAFLLIKALVAFNPARAWRWTGLAGLALALVAVSSPVLAGLLALVTLIALPFFYRRALIVIWAMLPSVTLLWPWLEHWSSKGSFELLVTTSWAAAEPAALDGISIAFLLVALPLGLLGFFLAAAKKSLILGLVAAAALLLSILEPISSSSPLLGFAALLMLASFAAGFDTFNRPLKLIASIALLGLALTQTVSLLLLTPLGVSFGTERQMPALVVAQSNVEAGQLRTLKITAGQESVEAELVWGDGLFLEEQGLASRYEVADLDREPLAALAGSLVAGNPQGVEKALEAAGVTFILLSSSDANLLSQLEVGVSSMEFLQPAGKSEFGLLWQTGLDSVALAKESEPHEGRDVQLAVLAAFLLLALPTPSAIRGSRRAMKGER